MEQEIRKTFRYGENEMMSWISSCDWEELFNDLDEKGFIQLTDSYILDLYY